MKCPFCVQPDGRAYKTKVIETRNYWEPNQKVFYVDYLRADYEALAQYEKDIFRFIAE